MTTTRRRLPYGPHSEQVVDLWIPDGDGPFPAAVLIHGGYWRSRYTYALMDPMAADLAALGFLVGNAEYRRPDAADWATTTADVATALATVAALPEADPARVTVIGHSAGGQLALRAAADAPASVSLAVSLAGVIDLHTAFDLDLGDGAVAAALGGNPQALPEVYAMSSPLARLPLGVDQLVVCGTDDELLPLSRAYAAAAQGHADPCTLVVAAGDHFDVIAPAAPLWAAARDFVRDHADRS